MGINFSKVAFTYNQQKKKERNRYVELLYNCKIEFTGSEAPGSLVSAEVTSGKQTIDLFCQKYSVGSSATSGNNYNLYTLGIDLLKLESRPIPDRDFEFMFYFDFNCDVREKAVQNLLCELDNSTEQFTFLGAYGEII